jgi:hypothetical protein
VKTIRTSLERVPSESETSDFFPDIPAQHTPRSHEPAYYIGGAVSPVDAVGFINSTCCTLRVASFCNAASKASCSSGLSSARL